MVDNIDMNRNGEIDYTEWLLSSINKENLLNNNNLEIIFKSLDKNGDGTLSLDEIKGVFPQD